MTHFANNSVRVKRLSDKAILPKYAKPGDAALTLYSPENFTLFPGKTKFLHMGYAIWIENEEWAGQVFPRSGKGTEGLVLGNLTGIIDSNYQGELIVQLWNRTADKSFVIRAGEGIAQIMITKRVTVTLKEVQEFDEVTERGTGGFGSTDTDKNLSNLAPAEFVREGQDFSEVSNCGRIYFELPSEYLKHLKSETSLKPGSVWRHHSGNLYTVIIVTNLDAERQDTYPATVVYQRQNDGRIWSRPLSNWYGSLTLVSEGK